MAVERIRAGFTVSRRTHFVCTVDGCGLPHDAKGLCHSHYKRWKLHGDPLVVKAVPRGSARIDKRSGYRIFNKTPEHRQVAEKALGHPLPPGAIIHHADEDRKNNDPSNLVVCPDNKYHRLIHQRLNSFNASGHYDWRKCPYCKRYDDPENMKKERTGYEPRFVHALCRNLLQKTMRNTRHVSV